MLQRCCLCLKGAVLRGKLITCEFVLVSRLYHGRNYKTDPARRIALAPGTLQEAYYKWKRAGELPTAFRLNYHICTPPISRTLMLRFLEFCAVNRLPTIKVAWHQFSNAKRNARQAAGIAYGQLGYLFSTADFRLMQAQLNVIALAESRISLIKKRPAAKITNHLPMRAPRWRREKTGKP